MADCDRCGTTLGEYIVRQRIGDGGSSTVYRCYQPRLRREVVIKVLHRELQDDDESRQRFLREGRLASRLNHPYAAHIYGVGVEQGRVAYIVMEMVHGITLKRWLATHGRMTLEKFVPLFERIALVVQAAHDLGIVHRDVKPSNIMVSEIGGKMVPSLLDFGIAKVHEKAARPVPEGGQNGLAAGTAGVVADLAGAVAGGVGVSADVASVGAAGGRPLPSNVLPGSSLDPAQPASGQVVTPEPLTPIGQVATPEPLTPIGVRMGSPAYMAPEQWTNAVTAGPAADIYSLGIVIYEVLMGDPPFVADTDDGYKVRHLYDPVRQVFLPGLDPILQRALAKEPRGRHGSVMELASELRAVLRASQREQLRVSAQRWADQGRPPGLLWGGDMLAKIEHHVLAGTHSEPECSFVAGSRRRARRFRWLCCSLVVLAALIAFGALQVRTMMHARMAQERAEAILTQAEVERGRAALLHGEPEAQGHLARAYQRDPAPSTAFMWARALQPRLAEQLRFASTKGRMWSAAFSPDSRQLVTTDDQCAQVRDAQTGRLLFTLSHGDTVYQALYSADGTRLITAGGDGAIRIWAAATGTLVRELTHAGRKFRYGIAAASLDGKLVAAIDLQGEVVHVWDATTGALLTELHNDGSSFPSLAFSADGRWLATSGGNDVRVFDARTWTQALVLANPGVADFSWDPTGPRLLTGASSGDASIWAIPSGVRVRHLREIGEPIDAVAFSHDGALVVAASRDGAEQVWSTASGVVQSQGNYLRGKIRSVEFDPTSKLIVAAGTSGAVAVSDAVQGTAVTVLEGPRNVVWVAHFDPSSRRVIGASWDGTAWVWDATSPYRRWSSPPVGDDCGFGTSPEPEGRFVAIGCRDHRTRVWDTARDLLLAELPNMTQVDGDFASAMPAVSVAGDRAAIARGNSVDLYELPGGRLLRTIEHPAAVHAVAFARAGNDLVSGAVDGSVRVTRDGQPPLTLPGFPDGIDAIAWLPDQRIVAASAGKHLRVYGPAGAILAELEVPARVLSLRTSPDGHRLVTLSSYVGKPAPPVLVDLERSRLVTSLEGHVGRVFSARFEAGQIFTAGTDGAVRRWDGASGQLLQTYQGSSRFLADATLTPDGSMVVAGGGDGVLRFWDTASGDPLWTLPAHRSALIGLHFEGAAIITRGFSGDISRWMLPRSEDVIQACRDRDAALSL